MKIRQTIGVCRYVYNLYLAYNQTNYQSGGRFVTANEFAKWLNHEYLPNNPDKAWIKDVSSKSVKQAIVNAQTAYKRFFNKQSGFPKWKKRRDQDMKMYFVKTNAKTVIRCERHRINIPTLGYVRLKEYGYLPQNGCIRSGTISEKAGRFYVTVLLDEGITVNSNSNKTQGIGVDLGVNTFATVSNGITFEKINQKQRIRQLEKKLRRAQRRLSRQYEHKKLRRERLTEHSANIERNVLRVQKLYQALQRKRMEYVRYVVIVLAKTKPEFITIEDLNISGMMKNRHISKAIAKQNFYYFRTWLLYVCRKWDIEIRIADRFYPSSKLCWQCGSIRKDLTLRDRVYKCTCGNVIDRDLQAAINLERCSDYKIA